MIPQALRSCLGDCSRGQRSLFVTKDARQSFLYPQFNFGDGSAWVPPATHGALSNRLNGSIKAFGIDDHYSGLVAQ
jgi:hypothetical protein